MGPDYLSSTFAITVGSSLTLWSLSTEGRESQVTSLLGFALCCFAMGVLWARRPWRNQ